jgi:apolipoprotein D and lipocalin family protein
MRFHHLLLLASTLLLNACASMPKDPIAPVARVDLDRFMGDWYVIASIPTFMEKGAHNAVESYRREADGSIATTFTFRKGGFDGPEKKMTPRGFVRDTVSNARWGMQFIWPIKAEYLIAYVDEQYTRTIIARNARDYVWIRWAGWAMTWRPCRRCRSNGRRVERAPLDAARASTGPHNQPGIFDSGR